jgi:hypothetical protein
MGEQGKLGMEAYLWRAEFDASVPLRDVLDNELLDHTLNHLILQQKRFGICIV